MYHGTYFRRDAFHLNGQICRSILLNEVQILRCAFEMHPIAIYPQKLDITPVPEKIESEKNRKYLEAIKKKLIDVRRQKFKRGNISGHLEQFSK